VSSDPDLSLGYNITPHFILTNALFPVVTDLNMTAIIEQAQTAKFVVMCLGEDTYTEKPGDINDLNLAQGQIEVRN
jgi:hypothetical protein